MTTKKAFVSGHDYIQDIHMEPGIYTVLMKVKSMYGDVCSFALFDGTTWTHYDMDTVQGQWKWAYVTFRILVPMTKINLISRNYSAELPVYVVEPQIVAGNVPFDAGVSPADLNKESKELQSTLQSMDSYIEGAFKDGLIESSEAKAIEKYLNTLHERKVSVDASYTQLHGNSFLEGAPKTNLEDAKTTLNTAYTNLIDSINGAISDGKTTQLEKDDVDAKFGLFSTSLAAYQARAGEANKAIQDKLKSFSDEAKDAADDAAAAAQALEYLKLAIGQDAELEGALFTLVTILLKQDMNADVTAGISGIQRSDINDPESPKDAPALWAGGTYDEAISGIAKAIIRHDGSAKFTDAEITGIINANSGSFSGALASPFERTKSTYTKDFSNNLIVTGDTFTLPWSQLGSGRLIRLIQPNPGAPYCTAPTGKYFYEDGEQKDTLTMLGQEIIELLGYTDRLGNFTGWLVLNRGLLHTVSTWGEPHRIVAQGRVKTNDVWFPFKYHTFDGSALTTSTGEFNSRKYTSIVMPEEWFDNVSGYYVKIIANGGDSAAFHTVEKNNNYTFRVYQHSLNVANGTLSPTTTFDFYFEIYSAAWLFPKSGGSVMPGEPWD